MYIYICIYVSCLYIHIYVCMLNRYVLYQVCERAVFYDFLLLHLYISFHVSLRLTHLTKYVSVIGLVSNIYRVKSMVFSDFLGLT